MLCNTGGETEKGNYFFSPKKSLPAQAGWEMAGECRIQPVPGMRRRRSTAPADPRNGRIPPPAPTRRWGGSRLVWRPGTSPGLKPGLIDSPEACLESNFKLWLELSTDKKGSVANPHPTGGAATCARLSRPKTRLHPWHKPAAEPEPVERRCVGPVDYTHPL